MTAPALTSLATGHVGLNVTDLDRSRAFYQSVLGLDVLVEGKDAEHRWVFLAREGQLVLTLWQQSTGTFNTAAPGLHHLSFQAEDMEQVQAVEKVVRELGATVFHDGVVAHREGAASGGLFFADPDGIRLEVFAPSGAQDSPAPSGAEPTCGFF
jgi:catechol-2,3-dioxygenase